MAPSIHVKASVAHADTDSDPSEEMPLAARAAANRAAQASGASNATSGSSTEATRAAAPSEPQLAANPTSDTPPTITVQAKVDKKRSHKKKGRNQYTRDREVHDDESSARSQSRDTQKDDHGAPSSGKGAGEGSSKAHAKSKGGMSSKITMNDMKRRTTALLDFISRTQVELAGESLVTTTGVLAHSTAEPDKARGEAGRSSAPVPGEHGEAGQEKEFKDLGCMEMMDSLTRRLVKWQQQYAAW